MAVVTRLDRQMSALRSVMLADATSETDPDPNVRGTTEAGYAATRKMRELEVEPWP